MNRSRIMVHCIRQVNAALKNRGAFGEQKTVQDSQGELVARFSSASIRRPLRKRLLAMEDNNFRDLRSSHIEDLIDKILNFYVQNGDISAEDVDKYGLACCAMMDGKWENRESAKGDDSKKKETGDEAGSEADKKPKGGTVVVTNLAELSAVVNAVIEYGKTEEGQKKKPGDPFSKAVGKSVNEALKNVRISLSEAMFGKMVASKTSAFGSIYGAVYQTNAYGLNEFTPSDEYITASFEGPLPFYGTTCDMMQKAMNNFVDEQDKKARAQTIANSQLSTNTMYNAALVDMTQLHENLSQNVLLDPIKGCSEDFVKDAMQEFVECFVDALPEGKDHTNFSNAAPSVIYIEGVSDGSQPQTMDAVFSNTIRDAEDVQEEAIKRMLNEISNRCRNNGRHKTNANRYIYLHSAYERYEEQFEKLGVKVLKDYSELDTAVANEVQRMYQETGENRS